MFLNEIARTHNGTRSSLRMTNCRLSSARQPGHRPREAVADVFAHGDGRLAGFHRERAQLELLNPLPLIRSDVARGNSGPIAIERPADVALVPQQGNWYQNSDLLGYVN